MAAPLKEYDSKYDWVKVRSQRKVNFGKREWNNYNNVPVTEDEVLILPRGEEGVKAEDFDMTYYFRNGFFEVVDPEPELPGNQSASTEDETADPENTGQDDGDDEKQNSSHDYECNQCGRTFDSSQGLSAHSRQAHSDEESE